jgi:hypothetical protein
VPIYALTLAELGVLLLLSRIGTGLSWRAAVALGITWLDVLLSWCRWIFMVNLTINIDCNNANERQCKI